MGITPGEDRQLEETVDISLHFVVTPQAIHLRCANVDATLMTSASGQLMMQRRVDKGHFREALWNTVQMALQKADALARRSSYDDDVCTEWTAQRCALELFYLLEKGVDKDREERGMTRAIDLEAKGIKVVGNEARDDRPVKGSHPECSRPVPATSGVDIDVCTRPDGHGGSCAYRPDDEWNDEPAC